MVDWSLILGLLAYITIRLGYPMKLLVRSTNQTFWYRIFVNKNMFVVLQRNISLHIVKSCMHLSVDEKG